MPDISEPEPVNPMLIEGSTAVTAFNDIVITATSLNILTDRQAVFKGTRRLLLSQLSREYQ